MVYWIFYWVLFKVVKWKSLFSNKTVFFKEKLFIPQAFKLNYSLVCSSFSFKNQSSIENSKSVYKNHCTRKFVLLFQVVIKLYFYRRYWKFHMYFISNINCLNLDGHWRFNFFLYIYYIRLV